MATAIIEKYSNKENPFGCEIFATIDLSVFSKGCTTKGY